VWRAGYRARGALRGILGVALRPATRRSATSALGSGALEIGHGAEGEALEHTLHGLAMSSAGLRFESAAWPKPCDFLW